ncbi:MAG: c-type cytochrome [Chryseolinea sp.]
MIHTVFAAAFLVSSAMAAPGNAKARGAAPKETRPAQAQGNAALGKEKAESERCVECHGVDGNGVSAEGKFAKLAGQYPDYILKQIRDFRSGARKHDQMAIMARSVEDDDVRDIAAYFSGLPRMNGQGGELHELGKDLFEKGDAARGVLACATCHGDKGKGVAGQALGPVIGGQEWRYLDKQLRDWRAGERRNSADGVMNKVTNALTDKEIEALADYLSGI